MKKIAAIIAAGIMAMGLGACGSNAGESDPRPTKTVTASPSQKADAGGQASEDAGQAQKVPDNVFVDAIKQNTDAFDNVDSDTLVGLAKEVCGQWAAGRTLKDVALDFVSQGFPPTDAGFFAGAATANYCPQYVAELRDQADELQGLSTT